MSTNDLTAGPELDAAVANAVDITDGRVEGDAFYRWTPPNHNGYADHFEWSPSTDLNAAFDAASACPGVDGIHVERTKTLEWYANIGGSIAYAETPALAICRAILALHGDK